MGVMEPEARQKAAFDAVVGSAEEKKLIVAGPGTGKTAIFKRLLENSSAPKEKKIVLTFINNLKDDLDKDLGALARVLTLHGYCLHLLRSRSGLRNGLTGEFEYFPPLATLIKSDWELLNEGTAPQFVNLMRNADTGKETSFYIEQSDYYDAVSYDDSVFRVYCVMAKEETAIPSFGLILVDEYQDFNRLEASFIGFLGERSPIVIAGDDDQALYVNLRGSSAEFIRTAATGGRYTRFELPYCMRCTAAVVGAFDCVVRRAKGAGKLSGRIDKEYLYYPPRKGIDSRRYPKIKVVETSAQMLKANYFGRYIEQQIKLIPGDEVKESHTERFPTVLIIGPRQYLRQVQTHLTDQGSKCRMSERTDPMSIERAVGLRFLQGNPDDNLGWRVVLEADDPEFAETVIRESIANREPLVQRIPPEYRDRVLNEVKGISELPGLATEAGGAVKVEEDVSRPTITLTSFEGSKGLSGQHVFIVGLHNGDLPRNASSIEDLEICKFLVALTRTRKRCYLLYTWRWGGQPKVPSILLKWIDAGMVERVKITKDYWNTK